MHRELKHAIIETALVEAQKYHKYAQLHVMLNEHAPAEMLPDGLSWYVEVIVDRPTQFYSHAYEVQLTRDGVLRAYGIGPGKILAVAERAVSR